MSEPEDQGAPQSEPAHGGELDPVWKTGKKRRRGRLRKKLSRHLGALAFHAIHPLISHLPFSAGRALAWIAGSLAYAICSRERAISIQNLSLAYRGDLSPRQIRALTRQVFRHTASIAIDWLIVRRWPRHKIESRFPNIAAAIRNADFLMRENRGGVVAVTAHLGNWELLALFFSHFAPGMLVPMAKRLYFPKYQDIMHLLRTETGMEVLYSDESARKLLRVLKDGKILGLLCDQDLRTNSGVFVEFFGRPAYTVTFPVDLARKSRTKLAFCVLVREKNGFRVLLDQPLEIPSTGNDEEDVLAATQNWTRHLEAAIRQYPSQWSWIHPRWRTTPDQPRRHDTRAQLYRLKRAHSESGRPD